MFCDGKKCNKCAHYINIRTHPLFKDFVIKEENGKPIDFEGCIHHLNTMFLRQIWVRAISLENVTEQNRNMTKTNWNRFLELARPKHYRELGTG